VHVVLVISMLVVLIASSSPPCAWRGSATACRSAMPRLHTDPASMPDSEVGRGPPRLHAGVGGVLEMEARVLLKCT
jgi:hypothetical protein